MSAYFDFVEAEHGLFRLIFESDLTNETAVRERVERADDRCAELVSRVIAEDTGLDDDQARLLASGLIGLAQTSARRWLRDSGSMPKDEAARLIGALGWRGISGFPRSHPPVEQ